MVTCPEPRRMARAAREEPAPGTLVPPLDRPVTLSLILPTRDEADNVQPLVDRIADALRGIPIQVIFVDDSSDHTPHVIQHASQRSPLEIHLIARPPERRTGGLGGAVIEGIRAARAPWICVMDADLQHPPELVPQLMQQAIEKHADLVVASRYAPHSNARSLGMMRAGISRGLGYLARVLFPRRLSQVSDPLTGFFLFRRDAIDVEQLQPRGFKILLEILIRFPGRRVVDVPFEFGKRHSGQSKASVREAVRYLTLLWSLRFGGDIGRLTKFVIVGLSGLLVNSLALAAATELFGIHYLISAAIATICSTLWNFAFTEGWVFNDRERTQGRLRRFIQFFAVNNAALALRAPILLVLTSGLNIHYLVSNLVSIGAMTILRYLFSDTWIWSRSAPATKAADARGAVRPVLRTRG